MYTWVVITDGVFGRQVTEYADRTEALDEYDRQRGQDGYNDTVIIAQVLAKTEG